MSTDTIRTAATYLIAILILAGAFALIYTARGDSGQAWLAIGAVLGYVFRDAGGAAATRNVERIAAAQPTVTTDAGPPATTTVTPSEGGG